ncbi:HalOD1 output domain-containing protein [Natrinema amylolyticum]|uniref:HalOD1 output domain-containing protein n=1 Tax=Natrinema amylolyticum TaxID=2878679 RepID=UPI001CFC3DFD
MEREVDAKNSLTIAVIRAVSDYENKPVDSLPPLSETVDSDALEAAFDSDGNTDRHGRVSFVFSDSRVTIRHGKYITVEPVIFARSNADGRRYESS